MDTISKFIEIFKKDNGDKVSDEKLKEIVEHYFEIKSLTEADDYVYSALQELSGYSHDDKIDWNLPREEREQTPEYIRYDDFCNFKSSWYNFKRYTGEDAWVEINGQKYTDEEAAKIAADKLCELYFGWHLQDNGDIDGHSFNMCALGTILAEDKKKEITEEMKQKAHNNFVQYYLHSLHFNRTRSRSDIDWANETFPDPDEKNKFDWVYGMDGDLYSDYGPSTSMWLLLYHSGIPEKAIHSIAPWKTGVSIRPIDNTVMYRTYQHITEL